MSHILTIKNIEKEVVAPNPTLSDFMIRVLPDEQVRDVSRLKLFSMNIKKSKCSTKNKIEWKSSSNISITLTVIGDDLIKGSIPQNLHKLSQDYQHQYNRSKIIQLCVYFSWALVIVANGILAKFANISIIPLPVFFFVFFSAILAGFTLSKNKAQLERSLLILLANLLNYTSINADLENIKIKSKIKIFPVIEELGTYWLKDPTIAIYADIPKSIILSSNISGLAQTIVIDQKNVKEPQGASSTNSLPHGTIHIGTKAVQV